MSIQDLQPPMLLPLLARGRHGAARNGACFMELASMLAGERWSDRPSCTHPLLAAVARYVNDYTSDEARQRLAVLIPSVIGLTSDEPHLDARIALRCATTALPLVRAERQRAMTLAALTASGMLADLNGQPTAPTELSVTQERFRDRIAPSIVSDAIKGIAQARVQDPDLILHDLLVGTIEDCRTQIRHGSQAIAAAGLQ